MSRLGRQDNIFEITQKVTMSQKIQRKDNDYAEYAGGNLFINNRRAKILTLKKAGLIPEKLMPIIEFYLLHLEQQRKAFFGAACTEITKLGFLLGDERNYISASKSE